MTNLRALADSLPDYADAAIITGGYNRRYLTGMNSSAGTLIVTRDESRFIIDSRYFERARRVVKDCGVVLQDKLYEQILEFLRLHNAKTLAVESDVCTLARLAEYRERLPGITALEDGALSGQIGRQRRIKSAAELERLSAAQAIADKTFEHILEFIRPGVTEQEIALELEFFGRGLGAEGTSFSFIVAAGKNGSMPHAVPGSDAVKSGDLLTMDFGFIVDGYCSDMTRTIAVGRPDERQKEAYRTVLAAQEAAFPLIKPGASCKDVDAAARAVIESGEFKGLFGHGLGHSLGLEVHESPRFNAVSEDYLEQGMVMSVEPGVYLPGELGVRIEDVVAVTQNGFENLTASPKELIVL